MTAFANKSFTVPMGLSAQGRDNWDRIFGKKKSRTDQYIELAEELVRIRDAQERDWQARERIQLDAMDALFAQMTPEEQAHLPAAAVVCASLRQD